MKQDISYCIRAEFLLDKIVKIYPTFTEIDRSVIVTKYLADEDLTDTITSLELMLESLKLNKKQGLKN